jgi:XTP/dITP diphosphohydrolase
MGSETKAIFVTSNENKRREAAGILGVELRSESPEVPEIQALDLREVAAEKAREARRALGSPDAPVLVEDSGLVVEAWEGLPGAFTKWFMNTVGNEGICGMLRDGLPRDARAVCVVAVADGEGVEVFPGEVRGSLAYSPRGEGGFGWDAIFVPEGDTRTYSEMGDEKHADSHRARAFRAARERLEPS